jgi:hypothetical protein
MTLTNTICSNLFLKKFYSAGPRLFQPSLIFVNIAGAYPKKSNLVTVTLYEFSELYVGRMPLAVKY